MSKLGFDVKPKQFDYNRPDRLVNDLQRHGRHKVFNSYTVIVLMVSVLCFIVGGLFSY